MRLLHDLIDRRAEATPDASALDDGASRWSWRDLADASLAAATALAAVGVGPGDRIAAVLPARSELFALLFGVSRLGAALAPLPASLPPSRLAELVDDLDPALVVDDDLAASLVRPATAALPRVEHRVLAADLPVLLLYTSGSTTRPRAVVSPQRAVVFAAAAIQARLGYTPTDRILCALPPTFDYGLYQVLLAAYSGAAVHYLDVRREPTELVRALRSYEPTVLPVVPTMAEVVARVARGMPAATSVRLVTSTGEALTPAHARVLRDAFPRAALVPMFGLTECKRVSIHDPDGDLLRPDSVGRPLDGTRVAVVDDADAICPRGTVGEIVVTGPHVMHGYWRDPELTSERFDVDEVTGERRLRTGDGGWVDADGYLYVSGRRDDIFKLRGVRVSCTEIEAAARELPGVDAAAVVSLTGEPTLVVTGAVRAEEVLADLAATMDPAKVPPACRVVDEIPMTANGKLDRALLAGSLEPRRDSVSEQRS